MNMFFKNLRTMWNRIPKTRYGKQAFLLGYDGKRAKILDIGCGNGSPASTKELARDCYYVGVDVGDYNQTSQSISMADEYHVFAPENFAEGIDGLPKDFDVVVSSHNLEHCNKPYETLRAMCRSLKRGGILHLSFPNSDSVNFPHRDGTLNFYDDPTHIYLPEFKKIQEILQEENMKIEKATKAYKPSYLYLRGLINELRSSFEKKILAGTWAFWGFESIIIARKK